MPIDKEVARQLRAELYDAINRGELSIQDAVKRMRKISRLTQPDFAAHRGVSAKVIKEIERGVGNPTVNTLNRIGQFFGLEVAFVRSERLRGPDVQTDLSAVTQDVAVPAAVSRLPIDESRRLVEELENIKKMVTPPKFLQDELKKMEGELHVLREARELIAQADIHQVLGGESTELELAIKGIDTELQAVRNARNIIAAAERIQRQIQPPSALKKWLADVEAAKKLLTPLDPGL
jgi:transcriptional regulator with XRE-family HTH domain